MSCACTLRSTATHPLACSPAPSRTPWSATCWPVSSTAGRTARCPVRAGRNACFRRSACPGSPPSSGSCCCGPPSAAWARRSCRSSASSRTCPSGRPPGASSARTSRSCSCAARRAEERPRPRHRRWTPPSSSVPRSMPWPATPSCSPPSGRGCSTLSSTTRRTWTRSRWSWYASSATPQGRRCWRATRTSPCSASAAPTQTAWTRSRRRRPCSGSTTGPSPRSATPGRGSPPACRGPAREGSAVDLRRTTTLMPRIAFRSACSCRRLRKPGGSRTGCGGPTCRTACRGHRWPCCPAPPAAPCRRCAGHCWPPASRSPPRRTSCRSPANPPSSRC